MSSICFLPYSFCKVKYSYVLHHGDCMTATSLSKISQGMLWGLYCVISSSITQMMRQNCTLANDPKLRWLSCPSPGKGWRNQTLENLENLLEFSKSTVLHQAGLPTGKWLAGQQPCWRGPGVVMDIELNISQQCVLIANKAKCMQGCLGAWLAGQDSYHQPPPGAGEAKSGILCPGFCSSEKLKRVQHKATQMVQGLEHRTLDIWGCLVWGREGRVI